MILDSEEKPPSEIVKYTGNHKLSFIYAVKYLSVCIYVMFQIRRKLAHVGLGSGCWSLVSSDTPPSHFIQLPTSSPSNIFISTDRLNYLLMPLSTTRTKLKMIK